LVLLFILAFLVPGSRSTCLKSQVGAALVRNKRVLAKGYNGAPPNVQTCLETKQCYYEHLAWQDHKNGHGDFELLKEARKQFCNAVHAEKNAINQCTQTGVIPMGASLYTTNFPCPGCVKDVIIPNGILEIVVWKPYLSTISLTADELRVSNYWLEQAKISIRTITMSDERLNELFSLFSQVGDRMSYVFQP
jgi:dCMP deaminase